MSSTASTGDEQPVRPSNSTGATSYLASNLTSTVSGFLKRFADAASNPDGVGIARSAPSHTNTAHIRNGSGVSNSGVYTPPHRNGSPFQPPPLYPLSLTGSQSALAPSDQILSPALAEEIRLLLPPRLQLAEEWNLTYSLAQDGTSLHTLYQKCAEHRGTRAGFVLVVRDGDGGMFGAYLSDPPRPSPHFYGNGECFLWRASIVSSQPMFASLPPLPSSDTTHMTRSTTVSGSKRASLPPCASNNSVKGGGNSLAPPRPSTSASPASRSGTSTPERIRFKAFPYSGVNDYMIFCEQGFLSVGGGDGHYGLWLDSSFEKGISSSCPTFGNEPLSEEGEKFEILGVEVWGVGIQT